MKRALLAVSLVGALWGATAQAAVTVDFVSVNPEEKLQIGVGGGSIVTTDAGIYNININNVLTPSFCIDVVHNVPHNAGDYNFVPLATAPNSPAGPMGATAANTIEGLWGTFFAGAQNNNAEAAALQVAIWLAVHAGNPVAASALSFGNDATTQAALTRANQMLAGITTYASLQGLVGGSTANEQGFVVPEPTTMLAGALLLLPFGASTLKVLRRKQNS